MRRFAKLIAALAATALAAQPVAAQSLLRDAETEALLRDMTAPIADAAGLGAKNVDIVLVCLPCDEHFSVSLDQRLQPSIALSFEDGIRA